MQERSHASKAKATTNAKEIQGGLLDHCPSHMRALDPGKEGDHIAFPHQLLLAKFTAEDCSSSLQLRLHGPTASRTLTRCCILVQISLATGWLRESCAAGLCQQ